MTIIKTTIKAAKLSGVVTKGNSKIHGSTFSVDPLQCNVGGKLRKVAGSTCEKCYAVKMGKVYPSAQKSWYDNLAKWTNLLETDPMQWINDIAFQIQKESDRKAAKGIRGSGLHRWFSAGDLPSIDALRAIVKVCELTPEIKHWLPTREAGIVKRYLANLGTIPANLNIRISAAMVDGDSISVNGCSMSTVAKNEPAKGFECPAYKTGGDCGPCVACWQVEVSTICYPLH